MSQTPLLLCLVVFLAACGGGVGDDLKFRGEIPVDGKLIYEQ